MPRPACAGSAWFVVTGLSCLFSSATPRVAAADTLALPQRTILVQPAGDRDVGDAFGQALAARNDRLIVGAPGDDSRGPDTGAAYVYVRRNGLWMLEAKLVPDSIRPGDRFGASVAIDGDRVVVGAPGDDVVADAFGAQVGVAQDRGAAYVYTRAGATWYLEARLQPTAPADGDPIPLIGAGDAFGASVAIRNRRVVAGAPRSDHNDPYWGLIPDAGVTYSFDFGTSWAVVARVYVKSNPFEHHHHAYMGAVVRFDERGDESRIYVSEPFTGAEVRGTVYGYIMAFDQAVGRLRWLPSDRVTSPGGLRAGISDGAGFNVRLSEGAYLVGGPDDMRFVDIDRLRSVTLDGVVATLGPLTITGTEVWVDGRATFRYSAGVVFAIDAHGVETPLAGQATEFRDGVGPDAGFANIVAATSDGAGGVYVADSFTIRHVAADGTVVTRAGMPSVAGTSDGIGATARLSSPRELQWDASTSTLYFLDGHAVRALRDSTAVVTIAGDILVAGDVDRHGTLARLAPMRLAIGHDGSLVVGEPRSLKRVTPTGTVTTLVARGTGDGRLVDGAGPTARIEALQSLAYDRSGYLFILDAAAVRLFLSNGTLVTVAGAPEFEVVVPSDYGASLSVDDGRLLVGGPMITPPLASRGQTAGIATVVEPSSQYPVTPVEPTDPGSRFGSAVALRREFAFVAMVRAGHAGPGKPVQGYVRDVYGRWLQRMTLYPLGIAPGPDFGAALAATDEAVFVGSPHSVEAPGGYVVVYALDEHDSDRDGLPSLWEMRFGLGAMSPAGADGPDGDRDGDGITNAAEYVAHTHPNADPSFTRFFAEGATSGQFGTLAFVANPGPTAATVNLRFLLGDGAVRSHVATVAPYASQPIAVHELDGMDGVEFSTTIESDVPIVADRAMWWPRSGDAYGAHAERAIPAPGMTWYFAEGATHSGFDLFYLVQNPSPTPVTIRLRYLRPLAPPLEKLYNLPALSRSNIWVNTELFDTPAGPAALLASTDVAAVVEALHGTGIIVERALYRGGPTGRPFEAGHESAGVTAPSVDWFFAEGATGDMFDTFVLVANPSDSATTVRVSYLLDDGRTFTRDVPIGANARTNIWVDVETFDDGDTFPLANAAFSTTLRSLDGRPVIAERSMWWPGPTSTTWREAHNSFGSTTTATSWVAPFGHLPSSGTSATYLLIANPSSDQALVNVTIVNERGTVAEKAFAVAPHSRFNVDVEAEFASAGPLSTTSFFGAFIASIGSAPPGIVVERATYSSEAGVMWSAGTAALATASPVRPQFAIGTVR